jgi:hypothetical protein
VPLLALLAFVLAAPPAPPTEPALDVRGVTLAHLHREGIGYGSPAAAEQMGRIAEIGGNWVALSDFAYMADVKKPDLRWGGDRTLSHEAMARSIRDAHAAGLQVMLKPHIWSRAFWGGDVWHADIAMQNEADWQAFFERYTAYVLRNASLAQEFGVDALCIGVEMAGTSHREADWRKLIRHVRQVYDGQLVYGSAFEEYQDVAWWDAVDAVGISAYFKLTDEQLADEATLRAGWQKVYADLDAFHRRVGKPIVFTEIGYTAAAKAGMQPWAHSAADPSVAYQARLYRVALEEAAKRDYLAGVFLWKWFTANTFRRHEGGDPYVIQDRPEVLAAIEQGWGE